MFLHIASPSWCCSVNLPPPAPFRPLPGADRTGRDDEKRMGVGFALRSDRPIRRRAASVQFPLEMPPFERQLATRSHHPGWSRCPTQLAAVEMITPASRLLVNGPEIGVEASYRLRLRAEADQLGMPAISCGVSAQYRACQQGLAPKGDEAAGIQVFRVDGPDPHYGT